MLYTLFSKTVKPFHELFLPPEILSPRAAGLSSPATAIHPPRAGCSASFPQRFPTHAFKGSGGNQDHWRQDDLEERVARRIEQLGRGGADDLHLLAVGVVILALGVSA